MSRGRWVRGRRMRTVTPIEPPVAARLVIRRGDLRVHPLDDGGVAEALAIVPEVAGNDGQDMEAATKLEGDGRIPEQAPDDPAAVEIDSHELAFGKDAQMGSELCLRPGLRVGIEPPGHLDDRLEVLRLRVPNRHLDERADHTDTSSSVDATSAVVLLSHR